MDLTDRAKALAQTSGLILRDSVAKSLVQGILKSSPQAPWVALDSIFNGQTPNYAKNMAKAPIRDSNRPDFKAVQANDV